MSARREELLCCKWTVTGDTSCSYSTHIASETTKICTNTVSLCTPQPLSPEENLFCSGSVWALKSRLKVVCLELLKLFLPLQAAKSLPPQNPFSFGNKEEGLKLQELTSCLHNGLADSRDGQVPVIIPLYCINTYWRKELELAAPCPSKSLRRCPPGPTKHPLEVPNPPGNTHGCATDPTLDTHHGQTKKQGQDMGWVCSAGMEKGQELLLCFQSLCHQ